MTSQETRDRFLLIPLFDPAGSDDIDEIEEKQLTQDDYIAKKRCIRIIKQMEFRCMNSCLMNYELSSYYEKLDFRVSVASSVSAGFAAIPAAKLLPVARAFTGVGIQFTKVGMGVLLAAATASLAYTKAADYLLPNLRVKTKAYNKAGAAWQHLELNIKTFLSSTTKEHTSIGEYRDFINQCAEKREVICNIARPPQWSYENITKRASTL